MCVCVCVCVCERERERDGMGHPPKSACHGLCGKMIPVGWGVPRTVTPHSSGVGRAQNSNPAQ